MEAVLGVDVQLWLVFLVRDISAAGNSNQARRREFYVDRTKQQSNIGDYLKGHAEALTTPVSLGMQSRPLYVYWVEMNTADMVHGCRLRQLAARL